MGSNVILSKGNWIVTISTGKVDLSVGKQIFPIVIPSSTDADREQTLIVDFKMITRRFVVNGHIKTGLGDGDSSNTASGKYDDLNSMALDGGVVTMSYRGNSYYVNFEKLIITEDVGNKEGTNASSIYTINFTAVEGNDFV